MSAKALEQASAHQLSNLNLNQIDRDEYRTACPMLSRLDIPILFECDPVIRSAENFMMGLLLRGPDIEQCLIKLCQDAREQHLHEYVAGVTLIGEVREKLPDNQFAVWFTYKVYHLTTEHDHGREFVDLRGYSFKSLQRLMGEHLKDH